MNNTEKTSAIRAILSAEISDFEKNNLELNSEIRFNEIQRLLDLNFSEVNEKNYKTLNAVKFLLQSINY